MIILLLLMSFMTFLNINNDRQPTAPILIDNKNINQDVGSYKKNQSSSRHKPETGLSTWIGKKSAELKKSLGAPSRIDPSSYGYDWWIYNEDLTQYKQFAVDDGIVISSYSPSADVDLAPFKIGETVEQVYNQMSMDTTVEFEWEGTNYRFELSEDDLHIRPLIQFGNIYAQVYFDRLLGKISSVRFMDQKTLVMQQPYELTYRGSLQEPQELTGLEWTSVERANELQIIDITNILRMRFHLDHLLGDEKTAAVAFNHSKDMYENNYFAHTTPTEKELGDRLDEGQVSYTMAGENIAAKYTDSIAVVEGWLNSKGHRDTMLNADFTHLGVGVYRKYYTQNFIQQPVE